MIGGVTGGEVIRAVVGGVVIGALVGSLVTGAVVGGAVIGALVGGLVTGAFVGGVVIGVLVGSLVTGAVVGGVVIGAAAGSVVIGAVVGGVVGGVVIGAVAGDLAIAGLLSELVNGPAISTPLRAKTARTARAPASSGVLPAEWGLILPEATSCAIKPDTMGCGSRPCSTSAVPSVPMALSRSSLEAPPSLLVRIWEPVTDVPNATPVSAAEANRCSGCFPRPERPWPHAQHPAQAANPPAGGGCRRRPPLRHRAVEHPVLSGSPRRGRRRQLLPASSDHRQRS